MREKNSSMQRRKPSLSMSPNKKGNSKKQQKSRWDSDKLDKWMEKKLPELEVYLVKNKRNIYPFVAILMLLTVSWLWIISWNELTKFLSLSPTIEASFLRNKLNSGDVSVFFMHGAMAFLSICATITGIFAFYRIIFPEGNRKELDQLRSPYFLTTLAISCMLIAFGMLNYQSMYASTFPIRNINHPSINMEYYCDSSDKTLLYPVVGNTWVECVVVFQAPPSSHNITSIAYGTISRTSFGSVYKQGELINTQATNDRRYTLQGSLGDQEGTYSNQINVYYNNDNSIAETMYSRDYTVMSLADYNKKRGEMLSTLALILSISIFSVSQTMYNIKGMLSDKP